MCYGVYKICISKIYDNNIKGLEGKLKYTIVNF